MGTLIGTPMGMTMGTSMGTPMGKPIRMFLNILPASMVMGRA